MGKETGIIEQSPRGITSSLDIFDKLLVQFVHLELSQENVHAIREILISRKLHWDSLLAKARLQRIEPLVAHHLMSSELCELVPLHVLEKVRNIYYSNLARNVLLQNELSHLLPIFHQECIAVIVLKGAALLGSIYQDISLRPMLDLDILVKPEHLDRTEAIALSQGYIQVVSAKTRDEAKNSWHQLPYLVHREKKIVLEIHQHFVDSDYPHQFDMKGFWDRALPLKMYGNNALTLAPEDMLIHLSIKFLLDRRYHSDNALGQLCDISEVIRYYCDSLDWNLLVKNAEECGIKSGIHFALLTCQQLLQTPVSKKVLQDCQPLNFRPDMAELFIRRRVLDSRPWLAHGLSDPRKPYNRLKLFTAIFSRFRVLVRDAFKKNTLDANPRTFYLRRIQGIFFRLVKALFRPSELRDDLQLDKWLSEIYQAK
jgi:hypothetical protein